MKNRINFFKKIGSLLIVMTLLAGLTSGLVVSAEGASNFAGSNAEAFLKFLNIIEVEEDAYQEGVTRGQLANIAAKVMNAEKYEDAGLYFDDVPVGSKYYSAVTALVKACVVAGDGGREYRPNDVATLNEACKIFSVILGYGDIAEFTSYLQTARKAGVLDGVGMDSFVTYEEALMMAYNTLHADMMDIAGVIVGEETGINYELSDGYQAIERYHGLRRCKGVVSGAAGTTLLTADDNIGADQIKVGDKVFNWDDESLLGKAIIFYCNVERNRELGKDIAYAQVDEDRTNIITIDGLDSLGADNRASEFKYYQGNTLKKVNLKRGYDVIYNGMYLANVTAADLKPLSGIVSLIDNNGDNVFDVISVEAYEYIKISKIDLETGELYSSIPAGKAYGSKTRPVTFSVYDANGKKIRPQLATVGYVAALRINKGTQGPLKITLNILDLVTGKVERISDDKIVVAGKEYKWVDATQGDITKSQLRVGDVVDVYGHNGFLGMIMRSETSDYQYGYLLDAERIDLDAFESEYKFMIINHKLEKLVLDSAKKVELDGVLKDERTFNFETYLTTTASRTRTDATGQFPISQLVRYRLNNNGELNGLDTNETVNEDAETALRLESLAPTRYSATNNSFYTGRSGISADELLFTLKSNENCFIVCDNDRGDNLSYKNFLNGDSTMQYNLNDGATGLSSINMEVYNVDPDSKFGEFVVLYLTKYNNFSQSAEVDLIKESRLSLDEEGNVVRIIDVVNNRGRDVTYQVSEDYMGSSAFNVGDLVQIRKDVKGEVIDTKDFYSPVAAGVLPETGWNPPELATYDTATDADIIDATQNSNPNVYQSATSKADVDYMAYARLSLGTIVSIEDGFIGHTSSLYSEGPLKKGDTGAGYYDNYMVTGDTKFFLYDRSCPQAGVQPINASDLITDKIQERHGDTAIMYITTGVLRYVYVLR